MKQQWYYYSKWELFLVAYKNIYEKAYIKIIWRKFFLKIHDDTSFSEVKTCITWFIIQVDINNCQLYVYVGWISNNISELYKILMCFWLIYISRLENVNLEFNINIRNTYKISRFKL